MQTGCTTASSAKFIQKYGYWEASTKVPAYNSGAGLNAHSDFWMHPMPKGPTNVDQWCPEIDVADRPTWDPSLLEANNEMSFSVNEDDDVDLGPGIQLYAGASSSPDLSLAFHIYGMQWINDGSAYGSIQMYINGGAGVQYAVYPEFRRHKYGKRDIHVSQFR